MIYFFIVYIHFWLIECLHTIKEQNRLSYESCIPIYLPKNLKKMKEIYSNIKAFIIQQEAINNNGTIHLIFTNDINKKTNKTNRIRKKFYSLNKNVYSKIRIHIFSAYFYDNINQMHRLSKVYWAHLLCFRIIYNALQNNASHMKGGIVMESDVTMESHSMDKILLNIKNIENICQKNCHKGWILDSYNFFVHDPSVNKKSLAIKKLQGKIIDKRFETKHVYLKNNCMGIQYMIYSKKAFIYIYAHIRKKFTMHIKHSKYAIDNQITAACRNFGIKIFTTKYYLLHHNQNQGSTWLYNCTLSKKEGDFYCP